MGVALDWVWACCTWASPLALLWLRYLATSPRAARRKRKRPARRTALDEMTTWVTERYAEKTARHRKELAAWNAEYHRALMGTKPIEPTRPPAGGSGVSRPNPTAMVTGTFPSYLEGWPKAYEQQLRTGDMVLVFPWYGEKPTEIRTFSGELVRKTTWNGFHHTTCPYECDCPTGMRLPG